MRKKRVWKVETGEQVTVETERKWKRKTLDATIEYKGKEEV
jgi:hypothetical protein